MPLEFPSMLSLIIRPQVPGPVGNPDDSSDLSLYTDDSDVPYTDEYDEAYSV